jgi:hypothetical protein
MAKKSTTPNFIFSQDVLIKTCKTKAGFIERDAAEFSKYNVTSATINEFKGKVAEMEDFPLI